MADDGGVPRLIAVLGLAVITVSSGVLDTPPPTYRIVVSEPTGNLQPGDYGGNLIVHWSCDPAAVTSVESEDRYRYSDAPMWTRVEGPEGVDEVTAMALRPSGSLPKVQTDAGITESYEPTSLQCVIYDEHDQVVACDRQTRAAGSHDPVRTVQVQV
ncbi:hypothetical protein WHI96_27255 [Pseudonocardia tropica]|uniref:Uncharacterized protein n=1 Tax=Pseudonocardia tropica TaxID=681289 RepID=A0ABV1K2P7_9PSEU